MLGFGGIHDADSAHELCWQIDWAAQLSTRGVKPGHETPPSTPLSMHAAKAVISYLHGLRRPAWWQAVLLAAATTDC